MQISDIKIGGVSNDDLRCRISNPKMDEHPKFCEKHFLMQESRRRKRRNSFVKEKKHKSDRKRKDGGSESIRKFSTSSDMEVMADGVPVDHVDNYVNPWSTSVLNDLLHKMQSQISKYNGYHMSSKPYSGRMPLSNLAKSARNKVVEIGGKKYLIRGCAGQGGFARVFKASVNSNPDDVVAMKIQKPAFPWEFYIYRQLDKRISEKNRSSFGFAHRLHLYSDYSILVCDYLSNGTLHDAINSHVVTGRVMEEFLCIYYTIEMLLTRNL